MPAWVQGRDQKTRKPREPTAGTYEAIFKGLPGWFSNDDDGVASERHGNLGRSDLELLCGERAWVFELKVAAEGQSGEDAAKAAMARINEKNCAGPHRKPLLVGLAVSKDEKVITAWMAQEGLSPENRPRQAFRKKKNPEPAPEASHHRM